MCLAFFFVCPSHSFLPSSYFSQKRVHTTNPDLGKKAQKVDLPYIACDVCNIIMTEVSGWVGGWVGKAYSPLTLSPLLFHNPPTYLFHH